VICLEGRPKAIKLIPDRGHDPGQNDNAPDFWSLFPVPAAWSISAWSVPVEDCLLCLYLRTTPVRVAYSIRGVLPVLVIRLQAVPVSIQNIDRIITGVVVKPCSRVSVDTGTYGHGRPVEILDSSHAAGHKTDMNHPGYGLPWRSQKATQLPRPKPLRSGCLSVPSLPL
jgi:hypothetical protein